MSSHFIKILLPILLILIFFFSFNDFNFFTFLLISLGYLFIGVIGNMIGYHRYLSHKSFETNNFTRKILIFLGVLSGQGSPLFWVALHRHHHKFSDSDKDIHSPIHGIWKSTLQWQIFKTNKFSDLVYPRDLIKDKLLNQIHRNYYLIYWTTFFLIGIISLETAVCFIIIGGTIVTTVMDIIGNYFLHSKTFGKKEFNTNDNSKNNSILNLFTFGAGYHNNHHAFPNKYKFGKFDMSALFIELIKK